MDILAAAASDRQSHRGVERPNVGSAEQYARALCDARRRSQLAPRAVEKQAAGKLANSVCISGRRDASPSSVCISGRQLIQDAAKKPRES